MKQLLINIIFLLCLINSYGQLQKGSPNKIILSADSVVIASHLLTYDYKIATEKGNITKQRFLVKNNVLNKGIIKEYVKLSKAEVETLVSILNLPETEAERNVTKCFIPHHGILIFNKKKISYIDICFDCLNILYSDDIDSDFYFSTDTWKKLKAFFKSKKMRYQLNNGSVLDHLHLNAK